VFASSIFVLLLPDGLHIIHSFRCVDVISLSHICAQVGVPCSSLFKTVTVRCGHCANLLSVNLRGLLLPPAAPPANQLSFGGGGGGGGGHSLLSPISPHGLLVCTYGQNLPNLILFD